MSLYTGHTPSTKRVSSELVRKLLLELHPSSSPALHYVALLSKPSYLVYELCEHITNNATVWHHMHPKKLYYNVSWIRKNKSTQKQCYNYLLSCYHTFSSMTSCHHSSITQWLHRSVLNLNSDQEKPTLMGESWLGNGWGQVRNLAQSKPIICPLSNNFTTIL